MPRVSKKHPRVEDPALAQEIGARLRQARLAAGLTQQQLAEGRYTKAYVSALENGLSRPSMSALDFFATRLNVPSSRLLGEEPRGWARLEADVALASGRWEDAAHAYADLLEAGESPAARAEMQSRLAEALIRLGRGREALAPAAEAAKVLATAGRHAEAVMAQYWLSAAHYQQENYEESKAILHAILARVRLGLRVEPDFELRLVMALSSNESRAGNHASAIAYLEEVRGLTNLLDDRRRAMYLMDLAFSYRETGDYEAAIRAGAASLELFRRGGAEREMASMENDLALSFMAVGNTARASELAASSRSRLSGLGDNWLLSHVVDTQARISLASGSPDDALASAQEAVRLGETTENSKGVVDALLTLSRARRAVGDMDGALSAAERAGEVSRTLGSDAYRRKALREWAECLAAAGKHEEAFAMMREALAIG